MKSAPRDPAQARTETGGDHPEWLTPRDRALAPRDEGAGAHAEAAVACVDHGHQHEQAERGDEQVLDDDRAALGYGSGMDPLKSVQ